MIRIALRNLWRQGRRSILLVTALAAGVAGAAFGDAFVNGWGASIMTDARESLPGVAQIIGADYLENPELANGFRMTDGQLRKLLGGKSYVARLTTAGIIQSEREIRGTRIIGVQPEAELQFTQLRSFQLIGSWPDGADGPGIVIGAALAERLHTKVGRRLVVMLRGADNSMHEAGVRVVGVYSGPSRGLELSLAVMSLGRMQAILGEAELLTSVALFAETDAAAVEDALPAELRLARWMELQPVLLILQDYAEGAGWFIRILLFSALAFGVVNSLLASVYERTREFGLMLAVGMRPAQIANQIAVEVLILVSVAVLLGALVAVVSVSLVGSIPMQAYSELGVPGIGDSIPTELRWQDFATLVPLVFGVGLAAALLPVLRAVRLDPVEAMRRY